MISPVGLALIRTFEGFSSKAYPDPLSGGDPWTYGYGSTRRPDGTPVQPGDTISKEDASLLLQLEAENLLYKVLTRAKIPSEYITQNRSDAVASFVYNLGPNKVLSSTFIKRWRYGDILGASDAMMWWVSPGTNVTKGLKLRRQAERALFLR